jgi:hypothetical protein
MATRRKIPVSDRRRADAEFRLHMVHKQDMLEGMVYGMGARVEGMEKDLAENTKATKCIVEKLEQLSQATVVTRSLETNGRGAVKLFHMLKVPFLWSLLIFFFLHALLQYLSTGLWPAWYKFIWELVK